jgi:hypothetical protein
MDHFHDREYRGQARSHRTIHIPLEGKIVMNPIFRFATFLVAVLLAMGAALAQQNCPAGYPSTTPNSDFTDAGNGTVLHNPTGLIWKRCAEGQSWNGSTCTGTAGSYTWQQAFARADDVNAGAAGAQNAGHTDWRLPNENELRSIVERGCITPSINLAQFPATPASVFWSGSPDAVSRDSAQAVIFYYGQAGGLLRSLAYQVRLVRAGQYFYNFDAAAPAAPTITGTPTAVPTLSEWAVLFLCCLVGIVGGYRLRRHARWN